IHDLFREAADFTRVQPAETRFNDKIKEASRAPLLCASSPRPLSFLVDASRPRALPLEQKLRALIWGSFLLYSFGLRSVTLAWQRSVVALSLTGGAVNKFSECDCAQLVLARRRWKPNVRLMSVCSPTLVATRPPSHSHEPC